MKHMRAVVLLVVGVVAAGGVVGFFAYQRGQDVAKWKAQGVSRMERADAYRADPEYVKSLFDKAQPIALAKTNGFLKPHITEDAYYTALLSEMIKEAKAGGKDDVAKSLRNWAVGQNFVEVEKP